MIETKNNTALSPVFLHYLIKSTSCVCLTIALISPQYVSASESPKLLIDGFGEAEFQPEYSGPTQDGEPYVARRWWRRTNGDVIVSVAEFDFKKPRSPKSWLRYWKTSHACVAQPVKDVKSLPDLGTQLTIAGVCKGGDSFAMHILHIDSTIVELNVASMDYRRSQSELIQLLGSFLSRVHSKPASEK